MYALLDIMVNNQYVSNAHLNVQNAQPMASVLHVLIHFIQFLIALIPPIIVQQHSTRLELLTVIIAILLVSPVLAQHNLIA